MLTFVIVNYNSKQLIENTVTWLEQSVLMSEFEILVIDNFSNDGSKEVFSELTLTKRNFRYIYLSENLGFAKACNIGARNAKGDILVFVNPDVEIYQKGIDEFIIKNLREEIGILAPRILYSDGSVQPNCGKFASFFTFFLQTLRLGLLTRKFGLIKGISLAVKFFPFLRKTFIGIYISNFVDCNSQERVCDWVSGACMIIRKDLFYLVGGFDENFFMYVEDEDLCRRINKLGFKIVVNSSFTIIHHVGGTQNKMKFYLTRAKKERYKSSIYYLYKYEGSLKATLLKFFYIIIHILVFVLYLIKFELKAVREIIRFIVELIEYNPKTLLNQVKINVKD